MRPDENFSFGFVLRIYHIGIVGSRSQLIATVFHYVSPQRNHLVPVFEPESKFHFVSLDYVRRENIRLVLRIVRQRLVQQPHSVTIRLFQSPTGRLGVDVEIIHFRDSRQVFGLIPWLAIIPYQVIIHDAFHGVRR